MHNLSEPLQRFRAFLEGRFLSRHTVRNYLLDVRALERDLVGQGLTVLTATATAIDEHLAVLSQRLAPTSQARHLASIKQLYRFLVRQRLLLVSPARYVKRQELVRPRARVVPEVRQIVQVLEQPPRGTVVGLRDRAMMELLYGAGVRVAELAGMDLGSVDSGARMLRVVGKGQKERLCPINRHALQVLDEYLAVRHVLTSSRAPQHPTALFLGEWGRRLSAGQIYARVTEAAGQVGLKLTPHGFRHAFATHLLHRGASVQDVQELLGHADLSATQRYTHLSEEFIRKEYQKHPRAGAPSDTRSKAARSGGPRTPSARTRNTSARPSRRRGDPARRATFSALGGTSLGVSLTQRVHFSR